MSNVKVEITRVEWWQDPFGAVVRGRSFRDDGVSWGWELPFSDPIQLIRYLGEEINKKEGR